MYFIARLTYEYINMFCSQVEGHMTLVETLACDSSTYGCMYQRLRFMFEVNESSSALQVQYFTSSDVCLLMWKTC